MEVRKKGEYILKLAIFTCTLYRYVYMYTCTCICIVRYVYVDSVQVCTCTVYNVCLFILVHVYTCA